MTVSVMEPSPSKEFEAFSSIIGDKMAPTIRNITLQTIKEFMFIREKTNAKLQLHCAIFI